MINEYLILLEKQKDELSSILRRIIEVNIAVNGGKPEVPDSFVPAKESSIATEPHSVIFRLEAAQASQSLLLRDIRNELSHLESSLGLIEDAPKLAEYKPDNPRPIR